MYFTSICISLLFFINCYIPQAKAVESFPLPIIVSIAPQKWIVEQIAGPSNVDITVMVRPGSDAHSYEPTPSQMKKSSQAKIYFTIGMPFESIWAPRIASAAKELSLCSMVEGLELLNESESQKEKDETSHESLAHTHINREKNTDETQHRVEQLHHEIDKVHEEHHHELAATHEGHHHHGRDPHTWLSPSMVIKMIPNIVRELRHYMPEKADVFTKNALLFQENLEHIDESMHKRFSQIDSEKRIFLTFHPAWHYFANEYGLKELTIEIEGKEASPKSMKKIIDLAKKYALTTIFYEPQFSMSQVKSVAEALHAKILLVDPLKENIMDTWEYMVENLIQSWRNPAQ